MANCWNEVQTPREPPIDILRRERLGEAEVGKEFREEEGLSASGRWKPGGRRGHLGEEATAMSGGFGAGESHRLLVLQS